MHAKFVLGVRAASCSSAWSCRASARDRGGRLNRAPRRQLPGEPKACSESRGSRPPRPPPALRRWACPGSG